MSALAGIRVLDFGRFIAGPYCGMLLADLGADVLRVDRRGGSEDRHVNPLSAGGDGGMFVTLNRNKRSLTLDTSHPQAAEILSRLVERADVVIANLPVVVMRKMGIDYDALRAIKPDIILAMISAFGSDGPYAGRVGFDGVIQAMSGAMSLTGFPGPPLRDVVSFEDFGTGLHATVGVLAALLHRQRTGQGQCVDCSLLATGVMFMASLLAEHGVTGMQRTQPGNAAFHSAPSDAYPTKDGWVLVAVIGDAMFARAMKLVGREDLIADPQMQTDISRANHRQKITAAMTTWTSARTTEEAVAQLQAVRVPAGPVQSLAEALADPQVRARGLVQYLEYPGVARDVPLPATPLRLSATPAAIRQRAPLAGEHNDEVLLELGFSPAQVLAFRRAGAI